MRKWLAHKLYPEAFRNELAYQRMKAEAVDAFHWLNGYPDAADALRWLLDNDHNRNRSIGQAYTGRLPADIASFREYLERRRAALSGDANAEREG